MDQLLVLQNLLTNFKSLLSGEASTLTYVVIVLIPVCILVAIREIWCWFFKQNKLVSKMEKIEKQLKNTNKLLENIGKILEENKHTNPEIKAEFRQNQLSDYKKSEDYSKPLVGEKPNQTAEKLKVEPKSLGDRKFSL